MQRSAHVACTRHIGVILFSVFHIFTVNTGQGNRIALVQQRKGKLPTSVLSKAVEHSGRLSDGVSCAELTNRGTHFSVPITLGEDTPQTFDVVADTGSNAVVVADCECLQAGKCPPNNKCFTQSQSSTLILPSPPKQVSITYGSGTVLTHIATEMVKVGGASANMTEGVMLLQDRSQLRISGPFEGILGLGPQMTSESVDAIPFMVKAGVERFSLCFNDAGKAGALHMGIGSLGDSLSNIGQYHWGLGLQGMKAGTSDTAAICDPAHPCAAIPDSGTTFLMGPAVQIRAVFEALCDQWPRCQEKVTKGTGSDKAAAFTGLLTDCASWLSDDSHEAMNEVPPIKLVLNGGGGTKEITLTAWAYVTETTHDEYEIHFKHLLDFIPTALSVNLGASSRVCVPSFGVNDYTTLNNGPIWILGTPLFFEYTVNYEMNTVNSQGHMSFSHQACQTCDGATPGFLSGRRTLRKTSGAPRIPSMDTSLPL